MAAALARQPGLWEAPQYLKQFPPFKDTDTIYLRFPKIGDATWDQYESLFYPAWHALPEAHGHVFGLMTAVRGIRLGRVMINRLPPGAAISRHTDMPEHTSRWHRHHLVLLGSQGAVMQVGAENVPMLTGMLFWFDNRVPHEVINQSSIDRISLIIDIQTPDLVPNQ